jgi:hypothetical protein
MNVFVNDKRTLAYYKICQFPINYESKMFYTAAAPLAKELIVTIKSFIAHSLEAIMAYDQGTLTEGESSVQLISILK